MVGIENRTTVDAADAVASAKARVAWVDVAKGISILLVVMMHSTLGVEAAIGREGALHTLVAFAEPFRMPAFFLVAGLFLARTIDAPLGRFIDGKALHFIYFYVVWMTIQLVVKSPMLAVREGPAAFAGLWLHHLVEPFGTLWFIYLLPIFFIAARLLRRAPPALVLAAGAALAAAPIATGSVAIDEFAARFVFFAAGWLMAPRIFNFAEQATRRQALALGFLTLWAVANAALVASGLWRLPGVPVVTGLAGAAALITISALLIGTRAGPALAALGSRSIVVYLAFFLPMAATRTLLVSTGLVTEPGLAAAIVTTAAVVGALAIHAVVMRLGIGRFLFERPAFAWLGAARPAAAKPAPTPA